MFELTLFFLRGFAKGWFPKGWFWKMFPSTEISYNRLSGALRLGHACTAGGRASTSVFLRLAVPRHWKDNGWESCYHPAEHLRDICCYHPAEHLRDIWLASHRTSSTGAEYKRLMSGATSGRDGPALLPSIRPSHG